MTSYLFGMGDVQTWGKMLEALLQALEKCLSTSTSTNTSIKLMLQVQNEAL